MFDKTVKCGTMYSAGAAPPHRQGHLFVATDAAPSPTRALVCCGVNETARTLCTYVCVCVYIRELSERVAQYINRKR